MENDEINSMVYLNIYLNFVQFHHQIFKLWNKTYVLFHSTQLHFVTLYFITYHLSKYTLSVTAISCTDPLTSFD